MNDQAEFERRASKFDLGHVVATPGAIVAVEFARADLRELLRRHKNGDWGDLSEEDKHLNDAAITTGDRILSAYTLPDGQRLWILTEADRSATTCLLPEEY